MDEIADDMHFVLADGVEITEVPDGRVIYQHGRERVHFLNPTAVVVLELCGQNFPVSRIERFLTDAYDLKEPPGEAVRACIRSLLKEELVRPSTP